MTDLVKLGIMVGGSLIVGGILFYATNQRSCMDDETVTTVTAVAMSIGTVIFVAAFLTYLGIDL